MGNHGLTCAAATVAEAFDHLYHFERAARILMLAYASGQPLNVMGDNLAKKTAEGWRACAVAPFAVLLSGFRPPARSAAAGEARRVRPAS